MKIVDEKFEWRKYVWQWQSACGVSWGREGSAGWGSPRETASSLAVFNSGGRTLRWLLNCGSRVTDRAEYVRCVVWIKCWCVLCYSVVCSDDERLCLIRICIPARAL